MFVNGKDGNTSIEIFESLMRLSPIGRGLFLIHSRPACVQGSLPITMVALQYLHSEGPDLK